MPTRFCHDVQKRIVTGVVDDLRSSAHHDRFLLGVTPLQNTPLAPGGRRRSSNSRPWDNCPSVDLLAIRRDQRARSGAAFH